MIFTSHLLLAIILMVVIGGTRIPEPGSRSRTALDSSS